MQSNRIVGIKELKYLKTRIKSENMFSFKEFPYHVMVGDVVLLPSSILTSSREVCEEIEKSLEVVDK